MDSAAYHFFLKVTSRSVSQVTFTGAVLDVLPESVVKADKEIVNANIIKRRKDFMVNMF